MRYLSVCSGIEAASVAWHALGWTPAAFSEIEAFPRAVLKHRWPGVPVHGDFTTITGEEYGPIDLLVGGTPCQSFSVAGLRGGLADDRGNLALEYLRLAQRTRPQWLVWENVPGVLSSNGGRDFGAILGGMVELGYGFAYRVFDAQYVRVDGFGRAVPQRRRRVFVVGYLGDWRRAAAVLFERESLCGHPAPRRQTGQGAAPTLAARTRGGGGLGTDFDCDGGLIAGTLLNAGKAAGSATIQDAYASLLVPLAFDETQITSGENRCNPQPGDPCHPLASGARAPAIAFHARQDPDHGPVTHPLDTDAFSIGIFQNWRVRRLTPVECERLQGFRDGYTDVPWRGKEFAPDGSRYKALGNSMAVNCMRWIGQRIDAVDAMECMRTEAA